MNQTLLLLALFFCHFLADYTHLSTAWMLNAKRLGKPLFPILCHALTHGLVMWVPLYLISGADVRDVNFLIVLQVVTHFLIDVWKGRMNGWFPALQSPANKWHWIMFGFDQFLHAAVIILMVQFLSK